MDNSLYGRQYLSNNKDSSPFRIKRGGHQDSSRKDSKGRFTNRDIREQEEDDYNRRREQEIRRHVLEKEAEMRNSGKNFNHSREPLDRNPQHSFNPQQHLRPIPERDRSPYGQGVSRDPMPAAIPPHVQDHVQNLQNDNTGLMRRLNLVLQELDRVQKEKEELMGRLENRKADQQNLQRILDGENKFDKVNKYLQDDLVYERDRNLKVRQKIKEEEMHTNELLRELRKTENDQDIGMHENQNISANIQKKTGVLSDIEKEIHYTQEKIRQVQSEIERTRLQESHLHSDKSDLDKVISSLLRERSDLLARLDNLTRKYDECVREISYDRAEMEAHNKHHAKLITAKIIFCELEQMQRNRKMLGFQEFKQYCTFDNKCHVKLHSFSRILERLGVYKIKNGFTQWYSNALAPMRCKQQAHNMAVKVHEDNQKAILYHIWRNKFYNRMDSYDNKTRSIQQVWEIKSRDSRVEKKRAFFIWKECVKKSEAKQLRVKRLIYKLYFSKLNIGLNAFKNHSDNLDTQIRYNMLASDFERKQYMTIIFNSFRYQTTEAKRKRHNILQHIWKGWIDYLKYKKYLLGTNVSVIHFVKECDSTLLKQCFDAWKIMKQSKILHKTHVELHDNQLVQIEQLKQHIENHQTENKFKGKNMACETVKMMMGKKLYGYFARWRDANIMYKEQMRTTIKERIIKSYKTQLRAAFNLWKVNRGGVEQNIQLAQVEELQSAGNELQSQIFDLQKDIQNKNNTRDCTQKKNLLKCVSSYERRMKEIAVGRWRDNCNIRDTLENGAHTIIRRLRLRFLRHAFDLYLSGTRYHRKRQVEEQRIVMYRNTRANRLLTKTFQSWSQFRDDHKRAKQYWFRIFLSIDFAMKQKAMKLWKQQSMKLAEVEAKEIQNENIEHLENLNQQMGGLSTQNEAQLQTNTETKGQMKKQAKRILSNYFVRFYFIGETRGMEKWKQYVQDQRRKESLMKKMLMHWKKYKFYHVKACIRNWMKQADIDEKKVLLREEEQRLADLQFQYEKQCKAYSANHAALTSELGQVKEVQAIHNNRLSKTRDLLVKQIDNNDYMSNKRYIFQQWQQYVKREVNLIKCIQKVITKSLWVRGFKRIQNKSRLVHKDRKVDKFLNKIRFRLWQNFCGDAMSRWKSSCFGKMNVIIDDLKKATSEIKVEHQKQVDVAKAVNALKAGFLLQMSGLKDYYREWVLVIKKLKLQRYKAEILQDEYQVLKKKNAIKKWQQRKEATVQARSKITQNIEKYKRIHTYIYFREWRARFKAGKNFIVSVANFASIHDHQTKKMALQLILSYSKGLKVKAMKSKGFASNEIFNLLANLVKDKKRKYLYDLKWRTSNRYKQSVNKAHIVVHMMAQKARSIIALWKLNASGQTLQKESYEEGPVREEFLEQRQLLSNLENFMKEEGYTEKQIKQAIVNGKQDLDNRMLRAVKRLQHYNKDLFHRPKYFDRWKLFVYYRKAFRYWLNFVNTRSEFVKGDLRMAFNKWKFLENKHKDVLNKMSKQELDGTAIKNYHKLGQLAEDMDDKENRLRHLCNQRDALLENYIKGQKVALAVWNNNEDNTKKQAFMRWNIKNIEIKNAINAEQVKAQVKEIAIRKEDIKVKEEENEVIASENEELRQFSLDGYEIAKSVQVLSGEREKLSVDLADKAQIIRRLLDENEKLNSLLKAAQDEVQCLINCQRR